MSVVSRAASDPVTETDGDSPSAPTHGLKSADTLALVVCSLIWGTTWFAITWQLGVVPPVVSVVYRFGLAAALLFGWCLITRRKLQLNRAQHLATFGQGVFTFGVNYAFVYLAESHIASAVAAVVFAGLAFVNLVLFRLTLGQRAAATAWIAACLGLAGVAVMSWAELQRAHMDSQAWTGLGFAFIAVGGAAIGNFYAHKAQHVGTEIAANTAWAMAYGTGLLAIIAVLTGQPWKFEWTAGYVGSLLYLSVFGSVTAFLLYFGLARSRGYTFASYIGAITPPLAMGVSAVFEHARWGMAAFAGVGLVVIGQILLIRGRRA
jgi:drug/metabolite transporter (DMT)-like permease